MQDDVLIISDNTILHENALDNLKAALYAAEKHGIAFGQVIENRASLVKTALRHLPRYTITDAVNVDVLMIKQCVTDALGSIEDIHGLPCEDQSRIIAEYCKKINKFGYSSIIAHHALYSKDSMDIQGIDSLQQNSEQKAPNEVKYIVNPCLEFLSLLDDDYYPRKRILFDCTTMPPLHCGTSEVMLEVYDAFCRLYGEKYDIHLLVNHEADEYHNISVKHGNILYPDTLSGTFHLGFAPNQLMHFEQQALLGRHCLKIVQLMLDIQMVRIDGHFFSDVKNDVSLGARFSDGILFISRFSMDDFKAYFKNEASIKDKKLKVVYIAKSSIKPVKDDYDPPLKEYFLITGNAFKHKAIKETIEAVSSTQCNYIVVGGDDTGFIHPNVYGYKSGHLDGDYLNFLYSQCRAVIFPSFYEGFGLPILMAIMSNKHVIVHNNSLNKELLKLFSEYSEHFHFYDKFEQIKQMVEGIDFSVPLRSPPYEDTWDRVTVEIEEFFTDLLKDEVDTVKLYERCFWYKLIDDKQIRENPEYARLEVLLEYAHKLADTQRDIIGKQEGYLKDAIQTLNETESHAKGIEGQLTYEKERMQALLNQFGEYKLKTLLRFAVRENLEKRHPKIFTRMFRK